MCGRTDRQRRHEDKQRPSAIRPGQGDTSSAAVGVTARCALVGFGDQTRQPPGCSAIGRLKSSVAQDKSIARPKQLLRLTVDALHAAVAFYLLLHAAYWAEIRYRQYVTPLLAVFAGYAIARISAGWQPAWAMSTAAVSSRITHHP